MAQTHKLSQMDIQSGGVQDHFLQNVLKFGFVDWKNLYETRRPKPIFPQNLPKIGCMDGENGKKSISKERKTSTCFNKLEVYRQGSLHINKNFRV